MSIQATLSGITRAVHRSLKSLSPGAKKTDSERIGKIIYKAMTSPNRVFHTPTHLEEISLDDVPLHNLAVLFHDLVYYQVDGGMLAPVAKILAPFIHIKNREISIRKRLPRTDHSLWIVLRVFGYFPGHKLNPTNGLNEFLSALAGAKLIEKTLSPKEILALSVCIEATIPFRLRTDRAESSYEVMKSRIRSVAQDLGIEISSREVHAILESAVTVSNNDVANFADKDIAHFLENTWKLIAEASRSLVRRPEYTIKDYRQALQRMEGFFGLLTPEAIFNRFDDTPSRTAYDQLIKRSHFNIEMARKYLGVKLLSVSILEAIADCTGGDAVLTAFMGPVKHNLPYGHRIEDYLNLHKPAARDLNKKVLNLFEHGRTHDSVFDMKSSPLSAYLYRSLGQSKVEAALHNSKSMFSGAIAPFDFLMSVDYDVVNTIVVACAHVSKPRRARLLQLAENLGTETPLRRAL